MGLLFFIPLSEFVYYPVCNTIFECKNVQILYILCVTASSSLYYIICLWPDGGQIGAETCSHSDKQIKNQQTLVVFWLSILTLIIYFKHNGDEPPQDPSWNKYTLLLMQLASTERGEKSCLISCRSRVTVLSHRPTVFFWSSLFFPVYRLNLLNAELNPICYLLALLAHHFLHVSMIRVKSLTLRLLMSYIYGAPILDVSRSHTTTHHSR